MRRWVSLSLLGMVALICPLVAGEPSANAAAAPLLPPTPALPPEAETVTVEQAEALVRTQKDFQVLDVRTLEEYRGLGFVPGAKHFDYFHFDAHFTEQLTSMGYDPAKPLLVYCALGGRSRRAIREMSRVGYKHLLWLQGGFDAWLAAKKPIEKDQK